MTSHREARQYGEKKPGDQRSEFQLDRDRLIYSGYFRRLAQVTQVASASEGSVFHNRLTHSLKVGQIARRLAEDLIQKNSKELINNCGGLDPDVVETAALAHDLGHPPFGHIAEKELDRLSKDAGLQDGFEGNAQTFRILTVLEANNPLHPGLDLTRATLNATLKYPWFRAMKEEDKNSKKAKKFSVYESDESLFRFVREGMPEEQQSLEASVMEFADDVTYSVHDLEDFYLAGLIPFKEIIRGQEAFDLFINDWIDDPKVDSELKEKIKMPEKRLALRNFLQFYDAEEYDTNSFEHIAHVKRRSSKIIQQYVQSVQIQQQYGKNGYLKRDEDREIELKLLQRIVWKYVIYNPRLATQQYGQKQIIQTLFNFYKTAIEEIKEQRYLLPARFRKNSFLKETIENTDVKKRLRIVVDIVSGLSEQEAVLLFRKLTGVEQGSVMDFVT